MKEKLLQLLSTHPATAGRPDGFLDSLADDLQAEIIRALLPGTLGEDAESALKNDVEDVYVSDFGIKFFNLYTTELFPHKAMLPFSTRKRIVRQAIETMLVEQCIDFASDTSDAMTALATSTDGPTLKRRLIELNSDVPKGPVN